MFPCCFHAISPLRLYALIARFWECQNSALILSMFKVIANQGYRAHKNESVTELRRSWSFYHVRDSLKKTIIISFITAFFRKFIVLRPHCERN